MTPEKQRQLTRESNIMKQRQHQHCEMLIKPCGPHMGLYCREHGTWIQWIDRARAQDLQAEFAGINTSD